MILLILSLIHRSCGQVLTSPCASLCQTCTDKFKPNETCTQCVNFARFVDSARNQTTGPGNYAN